VPDLEIQVAFQGGGAKFASMLPAVHAFRDAIDQEIISIHRVSGTSAGAICAALLASGANVEKAREHIVNKGRDHLDKLVPPEAKRLAARAKNDVKFGLWDLWRHRDIIIDVGMRGKSFLDQVALAEFLDDLFQCALGNARQEISSLEIPLFITASNIVKSVGIVHTSGDLREVVQDSCSLPILLRSFDNLRESHYVDGGICDNLPVDCLEKNPEKPIFAVFPSEEIGAQRAGNILSYIIALFSASINHNVKRSKETVEKPFQIEVQTDLTLLSFSEAVNRLSDKTWYESEKLKIFRKLQDVARVFGPTGTPSGSRVAQTSDPDRYRAALDRLGQASVRAFEPLSGQLQVKVNEARRGKLADRIPDTVIRTSKFKIIDNRARFFKVNVKRRGESVVPTAWSAYNETRDQELKVLAMLTSFEEPFELPHYGCVIEFLDENPFSQGEIIILEGTYYTDDVENFKGMNQGFVERIGYSNNRDSFPEGFIVKMIYPKSLGAFTLMPNVHCKGLAGVPRQLKIDRVERKMVGAENEIMALRIDVMPAEARLQADVLRT
jgi:predicted acylesterase/phospholipase RssA